MAHILRLFHPDFLGILVNFIIFKPQYSAFGHQNGIFCTKMKRAYL